MLHYVQHDNLFSDLDAIEETLYLFFDKPYFPASPKSLT